MSHTTKPAADPIHALRKAGPYPLAAYAFVQEALRVTVERIHDRQEPLALGEDGDARALQALSDLSSTSRHVSGQQLCFGLRDHAIEQFGLLARAVLAHWHIQRTDDFGRMVFAMIDAGMMSKTSQDTMEDFRGVFCFDEAFHPEHLGGVLRAARP